MVQYNIVVTRGRNRVTYIRTAWLDSYPEARTMASANSLAKPNAASAATIES